jgi:hypothetical protein
MAFTSAPAAADDEQPRPAIDPTAAHAVEAEAGLGVTSIARSGPSQHYAGFEGGVLYRLTRRLSAGVVGSYAIDPDFTRLARVALDARAHALRTRFVDAWGAGEIGFGFSKWAPPTSAICIDSTVPGTGGCFPVEHSAAVTRTRVGPEAGLGAGVDILPLPWLSIGVQGRLLGVLFDHAPRDPGGENPYGGLPDGPTLATLAAVTLSAHVPFL